MVFRDTCLQQWSNLLQVIDKAKPFFPLGFAGLRVWGLQVYNFIGSLIRGPVEGHAPTAEMDFCIAEYILEGPLQSWHVDPCRSRQSRSRSRSQNA